MFSKIEITEKIKKENKLSKLTEYLMYQDLEVQELVVDKVLDLLSQKKNFNQKDKSLLIYMLSIKKLKYLTLKFLCEFPVDEIEPYIIGIYLHDNDYLNRVEACEVIEALYEEYDDLYFKGMSDPSSLVRAYSVDGLSDDVDSNIFDKLLELEKRDKSLVVKISCRKKLYFISKDKKWMKKIYKNIKSKNYHAAIWAIRSIDEAIENKLLEVSEVKELILETNKHETRGSVKGNLMDFIDKYIE